MKYDVFVWSKEALSDFTQEELEDELILSYHGMKDHSLSKSRRRNHHKNLHRIRVELDRKNRS